MFLAYLVCKHVCKPLIWHSSGVQVFVRPGLAVPLRLHRGSPHEAVVLRAVLEFGAGKREAFSFVTIR